MSQEKLPTVKAAKRVSSIDIMRGLVMVIMALDHVRDFVAPALFEATDLARTSVGLFFTRWVTHMCAPTFVFLAGVSAFLYGCNKPKKQLSRFLFTRGIWLVVLELTVIDFAWEFDFSNYFVVQVIWAIGWSMIILSVLIYLPRFAIFLFAIFFIFGHNLLDAVQPSYFGRFDWLWVLLHVPQQQLHIKNIMLGVMYPLIPWPAIMALGYVMGGIFKLDVKTRAKTLIAVGLSCLIIFVVLRYFNVYGDPNKFSSQIRGGIYTFLSFINTTKYPPSLLYILMTLGLTFLLLVVFEQMRNNLIAKPLMTFGKTPFFFYILHLPIIHIIAIIWSHAIFHKPGGWWYGHPELFPSGYHLNLFLVYGVWLLVLLLLYPLCWWYGNLKARNKQLWWLSYL